MEFKALRWRWAHQGREAEERAGQWAWGPLPFKAQWVEEPVARWWRNGPAAITVLFSTLADMGVYQLQIRVTRQASDPPLPPVLWLTSPFPPPFAKSIPAQYTLLSASYVTKTWHLPARGSLSNGEIDCWQNVSVPREITVTYSRSNPLIEPLL